MNNVVLLTFFGLTNVQTISSLCGTITGNFSAVNLFRFTITAQPPPLLFDGLGHEINVRPSSSKSFSIFDFITIFSSFCHVSEQISRSRPLSKKSILAFFIFGPNDQKFVTATFGNSILASFLVFRVTTGFKTCVLVTLSL